MLDARQFVSGPQTHLAHLLAQLAEGLCPSSMLVSHVLLHSRTCVIGLPEPAANACAVLFLKGNVHRGGGLLRTSGDEIYEQISSRKSITGGGIHWGGGILLLNSTYRWYTIIRHLGYASRIMNYSHWTLSTGREGTAGERHPLPCRRKAFFLEIETPVFFFPIR